MSAADLSAAETQALFARAAELKAEYAAERRHANPPLERRTLAMLFQKPRQGRGVIEPRLIGGAVTALGWRSSRSRLRREKSASVRTLSWEKSLGFMGDSPPLLVDGGRVANCRKTLEHAVRRRAAGAGEAGGRMTRRTGPREGKLLLTQAVALRTQCERWAGKCCHALVRANPVPAWKKASRSRT